MRELNTAFILAPHIHSKTAVGLARAHGRTSIQVLSYAGGASCRQVANFGGGGVSLSFISRSLQLVRELLLAVSKLQTRSRPSFGLWVKRLMTRACCRMQCTAYAETLQKLSDVLCCPRLEKGWKKAQSRPAPAPISLTGLAHPHHVQSRIDEELERIRLSQNPMPEPRRGLPCHLSLASTVLGLLVWGPSHCPL